MPTTKPRYTFTDAGRLHELLDAAQRRWPEVTDRKELLLKLAEVGYDSIQSAYETLAIEERRDRVRAALKRIPSRVDADLLLSDQSWS